MSNVKDNRPGFYQVYNAVLKDFGSTIGPYGIALYNVLCYYAGQNGTCFPSLTTLGDMAGMTVPTVIKYLKVLEDCELISIEKRHGEVGDNLSNLYTINNYVGMGIVNPKPAPTKSPLVPHTKLDLQRVVNDVDTNNTYLNNTQLPIQHAPAANGNGSGGELRKVHRYWKQNMTGKITPLVSEQIDQLLTEYGEQALLNAIKVAVNADVRTMRYVQGILRREATPKSSSVLDFSVEDI